MEPRRASPRPAQMVERSSACNVLDDVTVEGTATVRWSDGVVEQASATHQGTGSFSVATPRAWTFHFSVIGPPSGATGSVTCDPGGHAGPINRP